MNTITKNDSFRSAVKPDVDAVVVGAGFTGLYMLIKLREKGFSARCFEAAPSVGGTWYWNSYPGARCDIESMQYSYQFDEELQQEWEWPERYAAQPDILAYIEHVADRYDLKRDITFETRVQAATFGEDSHTWEVETDCGERLSARFFIMSVGCLSVPIRPEFDGAEEFSGEVYQTSMWPKDPVNFAGKRIGVIGVGSSAVQSVPLIAEQAKHVYVYQRTPNFVVQAQNHPLGEDDVATIKADYRGFRAKAWDLQSAFLFPRHDQSVFDLSPKDRRTRLDEQWEIGGLPFLGAFNDILTNDDANREVADYWESRMRAVVKDPEIADLLTPNEPIGCKRLCSGTDYYEVYNRENVTLVNALDSGIERLTSTGLRAAGKDFVLDMIIYATGFDAMTGGVTKIKITGTGGQSIQQKWADGPRTYIGLAVSGFPNMFNMVSAGSPSVLATMVTAAEQHGDWVADCLEFMREMGHTRIDATLEAEADWVEEVNRAASASLRVKCDSWYVGSNVEGKARVFAPYIGGWPSYVKKCQIVVANGYEGFDLESL
ncbi:MAG: Phenylacetone monooxygenase [Alphaproteobacteria bacterium MarineAlpha11_Bin1]|nr:MAG: Phenylacetone monooxygenase [Alphaproteobacteria bacterium MarineAlpha11_Bin1]|tara:strand:- start:17702 stop:19336 length:1635 start_codon:yes stop_codon:yes gene_type:complete